MAKLESRLEQYVPEVQYLEERFKFIKNKTLRTNLSITFQYVIFLITLEEEITLQGPVSYSIFKNILLNTASIIEGSLHYLLDSLIRQKVVDAEKIMGSELIYSNKKILYKAENGVDICGIHSTKKPIKLKLNTNFIDINRACKRAKLLTDGLFKEVEELRDKRNKIHLAGLTEIDDYYDKKDIQKSFETASKVLSLVEQKLII